MGAILKKDDVTTYVPFCFEQRKVTLNFFGNITKGKDGLKFFLGQPRKVKPFFFFFLQVSCN